MFATGHEYELDENGAWRRVGNAKNVTCQVAVCAPEGVDKSSGHHGENTARVLVNVGVGESRSLSVRTSRNGKYALHVMLLS